MYDCSDMNICIYVLYRYLNCWKVCNDDCIIRNYIENLEKCVIYNKIVHHPWASLVLFNLYLHAYYYGYKVFLRVGKERY